MKIRAARKGDNLELIKPVIAKPLKDYNILLSFSDNPSKLFVYNATKIINQIKALSPLKNKVLFNSFKVDGSYFYWDDNMDISPRDLYRYSIPYHEWLKKQQLKKL